MADYYPLIARAVAGLDKNTGENRRALYERARAALVAQLARRRAGARRIRNHPRAAGARRGDPQGRGRGRAQVAAPRARTEPRFEPRPAQAAKSAGSRRNAGTGPAPTASRRRTVRACPNRRSRILEAHHDEPHQFQDDFDEPAHPEPPPHRRRHGLFRPRRVAGC